MGTTYTPKPDPGEIAWAWVPHEEDKTSGKDRPAPIIVRDDEASTGLTSKDHDSDHDPEAVEGCFGLDSGAGPDSRSRESEVHTDRLITIDSTTIRREGAVLEEDRFEQVTAEVCRHGEGQSRGERS